MILTGGNTRLPVKLKLLEANGRLFKISIMHKSKKVRVEIKTLGHFCLSLKVGYHLISAKSPSLACSSMRD